MRFLITAFFLFIATIPATANEIYKVDNIKVEETADDSSTARGTALANGEKLAFDALVQRFIDYGYIDKKPENITDAQLGALISRMEVVQEAVSSKTYQAVLNFTFNPSKVSRVFKINVSEGVPQRDKFLIIPVMINGGKMEIWKHEWLDAWSNFKRDNIILPIGDLDDTQLLRKYELETRNYANLDRLARKYKAPVVILLFAEYANLSNTVNVRVEKFEGDSQNFYSLQYPGGFGVGSAELYVSAANDILYRLEKDLFTEESADEEAEETNYFRDYEYSNRVVKSETQVFVIADDLAEWSRIRRKILNSENVSDIFVESFKSGLVKVKISYIGTVENLAAALSVNGLTLYSDGKNYEIRDSWR